MRDARTRTYMRANSFHEERRCAHVHTKGSTDLANYKGKVMEYFLLGVVGYAIVVWLLVGLCSMNHHRRSR